MTFEIDGIKSGKQTRGHHFMAPEPFNVKGFEDYREKLRKAKVILDGEERARRIFTMRAQAMAKTKSWCWSRTKACSPRMQG